MNIPYYILLLIYLVGCGVFLVWLFFNMYHLIKFGFFDFTGKVNTLLFAGCSVAILFVTILLLKDIPWFDTFNPLSIFSDLLSDSIFNVSSSI